MSAPRLARAFRAATARRVAKQLQDVVQDSTAVFATHDFFSCFYAMRRLGGHLHMTVSTNFVFHRNDHSVAFALEKTFDASLLIFVDFTSHLGVLLRQLFQPSLHGLFFRLQFTRL